MELPNGKKVFFLSDFHLGAPNASESRVREKKLVRFLESIEREAFAIYLVGDLFDFWFEYKLVVPKGYTRLLGTLARLSDQGVELHFLVGNHDMWVRNYFQEELNMKVYFGPQSVAFNNKRFYIAHGDGLGPGDHKYKFLKKIFRNPVCQWLFGVLPPTIGMGAANFFSHRSRQSGAPVDAVFYGEDKEWLIIHSRELLKSQQFDYFIYGHRHLPGIYKIGDHSEYVNLGDWITYFTYAEFDGARLHLKTYRS